MKKMREKIESSGLTPLFVSKKVGIEEGDLINMLDGKSSMTSDVKSKINDVLAKAQRIKIANDSEEMNRLRERVKTCGLTSVFICKMLGIEPVGFSLRLKGQIKLSSELKDKLEIILTQAENISLPEDY